MRVLSAVDCALFPYTALFPQVVKPAYAGTDFPYIVGIWGQSPVSNSAEAEAQANIVALPEVECIRLRTIFVPHYPDSSFRSSQESNGTGYPALTWTHGPDSVSYVAQRPGLGHVWQYQPGGSSTYWLYYDRMPPYTGRIAVAEVLASAPPASATSRHAYTTGSWQGFQWFYRFFSSGSGSIAFYVALEGDSPYRWVRVQLAQHQEPTIAIATASLSDIVNETGGIRWDVLQRFQLPSDIYANVSVDDRFSAVDPPKFHHIQFEVLNEKLVITLDGTQKPMVVPAEGKQLIIAALIRYRGFQDVVWHGAPLKYVSSGVWESADHALGFMPISEPALFVHDAGSPTGTSAVAAVVDASTARYRLELVGSTPEGSIGSTSYSAKSPVVRAVTYTYPIVINRTGGSGIPLSPEAVVIQHVFDYNSLTIQSRAALTFSNNAGEWAWYQRGAGQSGIAINLGSEYYGVFRQFTGIANRMNEAVGEAGASKFVMQCVDRSAQLRNPRWNLPWMDGWNIYYAIAFLAQLGGVSPEDMTFAPLIPPDPYSGVDWFLPVGHAGTPLTRFSGQELWSIIVKLAYTIGYMVFFDAYGKLQFRKFTIPAGIYRTFYESDVGAPNACWQISVHRSFEEVRNTVTVVGIDAYGPLWNPIVSHRQDNASIYDPSAPNYIGWEQPLVWADSQFADIEYASEAADALIAFLRHPAETVTFTTWLQPDIYPLNVIAVDAPRFGTTGKRYLVVGVQHRVHDVALGETTITARYIP